MFFSGTNTDLARERQDYAARQDRMVAEDCCYPPQRIAPSTPAEQAEISRLIFSREIYRKDETMIATAEVNGQQTTAFKARVVAIESATKFIDQQQRATVALQDCDPQYREIRFPIPESLHLELDDVLAVTVQKVGGAE